jgi:hypothetical protein
MREDQTSPEQTFTRLVIRNVFLGTVFMYVASVAICLPSQSIGMAAGIAALPAIFAGPFVGGLLTVTTRHDESDDDLLAGTGADVRPLAPPVLVTRHAA